MGGNYRNNYKNGQGTFFKEYGSFTGNYKNGKKINQFTFNPSMSIPNSVQSLSFTDNVVSSYLIHPLFSVTSDVSVLFPLLPNARYVVFKPLEYLNKPVLRCEVLNNDGVIEVKQKKRSYSSHQSPQSKNSEIEAVQGWQPFLEDNSKSGMSQTSETKKLEKQEWVCLDLQSNTQITGVRIAGKKNSKIPMYVTKLEIEFYTELPDCYKEAPESTSSH